MLQDSRSHAGMAKDFHAGSSPPAPYQPPALGPDGKLRTDCYADPQFLIHDTDFGPALLVVDGTRLHRIAEPFANLLIQASRGGLRDEISQILTALGIETRPIIDDTPCGPLPVRAFSLAVAQKCNLGCSYCYADGGDFGGPAKNMTSEVAFAAIDRLFGQVSPGERVNLAFLGGEPFINRPVLVAATEYAAEKSRQSGVEIGFSVTTNGTLITPEDGQFLDHYGFAVTVSLDGVGEDHNQLRPFKSGRGTYDRIVERIRPLLAMQQQMQISARATVTPRNLNLRKTLDELVALGFKSVGFAPMVNSPTGRDEMTHDEFKVMLGQMIDCGREFEHRVVTGEHYPFSNMDAALRHIHRGSHQPYPCGAGGGYFGVSADGELSACHRFVADPNGWMGNLTDGVDLERQTAWLAERHVHRQQPCKICWARYMCGGGCHHEVIHRGRKACDYIRGWLIYVMQAYMRLRIARPSYFEPVASGS